MSSEFAPPYDGHVLLNAMFGFGIVSLAGAEEQIAWEAHIGGFLFGLFCFGFFDRQPHAAPPQAV